MSKILITSDFHLEPGLQVSICIDYIDYIIEYSKKNDIKNIIIAGDLFEKSTKIKNEAFLPLFRKFKEIKDTCDIKIYIIIGNHDTFNDSNESIVEVFSPFAEVIQDFSTIEIDGYKIDLLAYTKDENKINRETDSQYLITHLGIMSFSFDNGYECDEKLTFKPESFSKYKYVFSGHFHRFQAKGNIIFQGSPYQTSREEEGHKKGFVVFELGGEWTFEEYENAPKYITVTAEQLLDGIDLKNKFVSVKITEKVDNFVQLKHLLYEKGAIDVKPVFIKEEEDFDILKENVGFKINDNVEKLLDDHIKTINIEGIDNKILFKILQKIREEL